MPSLSLSLSLSLRLSFAACCLKIDTAVRYCLPFLAVVGNEARWNAEYQIQLRDYGRDRLIGSELLPASCCLRTTTRSRPRLVGTANT